MKTINDKKLLATCGILGILAVGLGAFGAHGLKTALPSDKLAIYTTGITYHFYHTITLLFVVVLMIVKPNVWFNRAAIFFIIGIFLFSGSLYLLATRDLIGLTQYKWLGPLTPIGGVFFMLGWLSLCLGAFFQNDSNAAK